VSGSTEAAMAAAGTTPLIDIDAVVLDTETTGLDTRKARIVQIGAVRIVRGRVVKDTAFSTLVDPGGPISRSSVAIHGIDDRQVAGAPAFAEAYDMLRNFAGDAIVVGHAIGFDMAIMARQCGEAGIAFAPAPTLDTTLLAAVAEPALPDAALETLAAWLGVEVTGRHTAPGDALVTADIFTALLPHLRKRGIRTLGEAQAACRELADAMVAAGHPRPAPLPTAAAEGSLARIDAYPYRHRNRDVMSAPPLTIPADKPVSEAVRVMTGARVSSLFVIQGEGANPDAIVTERDVMRVVAARGAAALEAPVGDIASSPLVAVEADDYVFRAIGRMANRRIRHLAVVDAAGVVVGALSARDLLRLRSGEALSLGDRIDAADDAGALAAAWCCMPAVAASLLEEGVAAHEIAAVASREIAAMTRRAAVLAEERLAKAGEGGPPVPYALFVLGSAGRGESLLAPDQDNAVVFADDGDGDRADAWFAKFGKFVADILDEAGIPYCKGGVMAVNSEWRQSVGGWKQRIGEWVARSGPRDLLNVDIFFDLTPVHGQASLADEIWRHAYEMGGHGADFAKLLAEASAGFEPPISLFGGFRSAEGRVDLKGGGLLPIVSSARVLSIRHHVIARSTPDRIAGVRALDIGAASDLDRLILIHRLIMDCLLRQQLEDIQAGLSPSNRVDVRRLSRPRRSELRDALKALRLVDVMTRELLFAKPANT
jgi:CBS domain-containing protein